MSKEWKEIYNNKIGTSKDKTKEYNRLMATTKTKTIYDLKKEGDELYAKKLAYENHLIDAYNNNKLTDKVLIKEVKNIIAKRESKNKPKED